MSFELCAFAILVVLARLHVCAADLPRPFGSDFPNLDSLAVSEWWQVAPQRHNPPPPMDMPRDKVVAFAFHGPAVGRKEQAWTILAVMIFSWTIFFVYRETDPGGILN